MTEPTWHVVQTNPREEERFLAELERLGVAGYCPKVLEYRRRRHRYEKVPLFSSYVFARFRFPEDYHLLQWSRGLKRLVRFGETPPTLPAEVMESFFRRTNGEGVVELGMDLHRGDQVKIRSGPFKDMVGTILRCDSPKGRILILMEILAGQVRLEADKNQVLAI